MGQGGPVYNTLNLLLDGLIKNGKAIMIVARAAGTATRRLTVVAIGNGVVRSSSLALLKENGGSSELKKNWGQGVLQSMK